MGHNDSSDMDKLKEALSSLTDKLGSVEDVLETFGLSNLPVAQRYGIFFGICVFSLTITTVGLLLIFGGSFARIAQENAANKDPTRKDAGQVRRDRALLYESLLETRDRMVKENYPPPPNPVLEGRTKLTEMLMNASCKDVADLVAEDETKRHKAARFIPDGYEENYKTAYRTCQDKPGGAILAGRPEARFEAYARAYAGCGVHTSTDYRRSYARLYESIACKSQETDDMWNTHFETRPQDIVGRTVRLEALETARHAEVIHDITCGAARLDSQSFDPNKLWAFRPCGPFESADALAKSDVFVRQCNEAAFAIVENVTESVVGVVILTNDDPRNLSIQLEPPIVKPSCEESQEQLEACFLLMDRLFAHGYRRIQMSVDSQDFASKKLAMRLGFTQEGFLPKNMIVKDANRDSWVYGMINTDWKKGARAALFKKLHGATMQRADAANNIKEGELEVQQNFLKEQKKTEDASAAKKNA